MEKEKMLKVRAKVNMMVSKQKQRFVADGYEERFCSSCHNLVFVCMFHVNGNRIHIVGDYVKQRVIVRRNHVKILDMPVS